MEIDEALAHQLYADDHRQAQQEHDQARRGGAPGPPQPVTYQTYIPRSHRNAPEGGPQAQQTSPAGILPGERESWHRNDGQRERHRDELDEITEGM